MMWTIYKISINYIYLSKKHCYYKIMDVISDFQQENYHINTKMLESSKIHQTQTLEPYVSTCHFCEQKVGMIKKLSEVIEIKEQMLNGRNKIIAELETQLKEMKNQDKNTLSLKCKVQKLEKVIDMLEKKPPVQKVRWKKQTNNPPQSKQREVDLSFSENGDQSKNYHSFKENGYPLKLNLQSKLLIKTHNPQLSCRADYFNREQDDQISKRNFDIQNRFRRFHEEVKKQSSYHEGRNSKSNQGRLKSINEKLENLIGKKLRQDKNCEKYNHSEDSSAIYKFDDSRSHYKSYDAEFDRSAPIEYTNRVHDDLYYGKKNTVIQKMGSNKREKRIPTIKMTHEYEPVSTIKKFKTLQCQDQGNDGKSMQDFKRSKIMNECSDISQLLRIRKCYDKLGKVITKPKDQLDTLYDHGLKKKHESKNRSTNYTHLVYEELDSPRSRILFDNKYLNTK